MKFKKLIAVGIIQGLTINSILLFSLKSAWSLDCPFDSYIIMNGKCINLNQQSNTNSNNVPRRIDSYNSKEKPVAVDSISKKTCRDFQYQYQAQRYFDLNSEYKSKFDLDNDGYVCENLTRIRGNILTMKIWQTLKYENRQRKRDSENKHALTFTQVNRIIGFAPNPKKERRRHVWEDPISNKRIEIRFFEGEIKDMKGMGF